MLSIPPLVCVQTDGRINNISKKAIFDDNDATEVKFASFDGAGDGGHSGVGLVEISKMFATQVDFFNGMAPFDRVVRLIDWQRSNVG